jgi:hypothetical protein
MHMPDGEDGMLTEYVTAAVLIAAPVNDNSESRPSHMKVAMAAALLLANGEKRYEPPEEKEIKGPQYAAPPLTAEMPSPVRTPLHPQREALPKTDTPLAESMPSPTGQMLLAQASPSNEEILRRLEQLERENRQLRQQNAPQPGFAPASAPPPAAAPRGRTPSQMIPGWRVSLYPWNAEGFTSGDPVRVFNMSNQRFSAVLGQAAVDRTDRRLAREVRRFGHTNEMFVYKLEGWLQVREAGQYQLGFELNCGFGHPCNVLAKIGDQQLFNERHQKFENKMLFQGRTLPAGNYRVEIVFNISTKQFMKFSPERVSLYPQIRGPGEYNFRDFRQDELLTEAHASIPSGPPR